MLIRAWEPHVLAALRTLRTVRYQDIVVQYGTGHGDQGR